MEMIVDNTLHNLRVLYVEDEDFTRQEMKKFLSRRVGKLYTAEDGESGVRLFNEHRPDVVIADLVMPNIGGLEMSKRIRDIDHECYILIASAIEDPKSIIETVDVGIVSYLLKPIDTKKLLGVLNDIGVKIAKKKRLKFLFDRDKKKSVEDGIKRKVSSYIKLSSGKGPREVAVHIQGNIIEIRAYDTLTNFEKSMLDKNMNRSIVEQNRKLYYSIQKQPIEECIKDIVGSKVEMYYVETDTKADRDILRLSIDI